MLTFDEGLHEYRWDGRVVPSVTQILKATYPNVYAGIPQPILDRKARLGTASHKVIELHLLDRLDLATIHPEVEPFYMSWLDWWLTFAATPYLSERKFYNEAEDVSGQIDYEDDEWMLDWKCTLTPTVTHPIQMGGYSRNARKAKRFGCLYLRKDGSTAQLVEHDTNEITRDWKATLRVFDINRGMK